MGDANPSVDEVPLVAPAPSDKHDFHGDWLVAHDDMSATLMSDEDEGGGHTLEGPETHLRAEDPGDTGGDGRGHGRRPDGRRGGARDELELEGARTTLDDPAEGPRLVSELRRPKNRESSAETHIPELAQRAREPESPIFPTVPPTAAGRGPRSLGGRRRSSARAVTRSRNRRPPPRRCRSARIPRRARSRSGVPRRRPRRLPWCCLRRAPCPRGRPRRPLPLGWPRVPSLRPRIEDRHRGGGDPRAGPDRAVFRDRLGQPPERSRPPDRHQPTSDVEILLDGNLVAVAAPVDLEGLALGDHTIEVRAKGYLVYRQAFPLNEPRPHTLTIPLTPAPAAAAPTN